jgi:hypothetical protein
MNRTSAVTSTAGAGAARSPILSLAAHRWMTRRIPFNAESRERQASTAAAAGVSVCFKCRLLEVSSETDRKNYGRFITITAMVIVVPFSCGAQRPFFIRSLFNIEPATVLFSFPGLVRWIWRITGQGRPVSVTATKDLGSLWPLQYDVQSQAIMKPCGSHDCENSLYWLQAVSDKRAAMITYKLTSAIVTAIAAPRHRLQTCRGGASGVCAGGL